MFSDVLAKGPELDYRCDKLGHVSKLTLTFIRQVPKLTLTFIRQVPKLTLHVIKYKAYIYQSCLYML